MTSLQAIDNALLLIGAVLAVALLFRALRPSGGGRVGNFPPPPVQRLTGLDVMVAAGVSIILPGVVVWIWFLGDAERSEIEITRMETTATSPGPSLPARSNSAGASRPAMVPDKSQPRGPDPRYCVPTAIGYLAAIALLMLLAQARFVQGIRGLFPARPSAGRTAAWALIAYLAAWPVCTGLLMAAHALLQALWPDWSIPLHGTLRMLRDPSAGLVPKAATVLTALLLAPLNEELFFRGILQSTLAARLRSDWVAILFSGLMFGWIHHPLPDTVPALIFFGWVLGYAYARTRSLTLPILIHVLFNGRTLLWMALGAEPTA